jgi:uncharacterized protein (UPF0335 family)
MVAKKAKNAAEGEIPKPKTGAWGKAPAQEEIEFDPSKIASPDLNAVATDGTVGDDATVAETHAAEGWQQPFRDGYTEEQPSPYDTQVAETAKTKKPARDKKRAPVDKAPTPRDSNGELIAIVERVERLMEEVSAIRGDIKEVFGEAKGTGFDVATIRRVISYRAKDADKVAEQEALFDTYFHAIGGRK